MRSIETKKGLLITCFPADDCPVVWAVRRARLNLVASAVIVRIAGTCLSWMGACSIIHPMDFGVDKVMDVVIISEGKAYGCRS